MHGRNMIAALKYFPPADEHREPTALEADAVLGTFTNRWAYLPDFLASWEQYLSRIPLIVVRHRGNIREGMALLRQEFIATGRRWWFFLDDDIQFLCPEIVHDTVAAMIRNRWHLATVYSSFDPDILQKPYEEAVAIARQRGEREILWAPGYLIAVDSYFCGWKEPDPVPAPNTAIDTTYTIGLRRAGMAIGLVPHVVYHRLKPTKPNWEEHRLANEYVQKVYGDFYWKSAHYQGNVYEWGEHGTDDELEPFRKLCRRLGIATGVAGDDRQE